MGSNGVWNDHVCSTQYRHFVCNYPAYTLVTSQMNFENGEEYCNNNLGSNLATVNSQDANDAAVSAASGNTVWIGLYDPEADNTYSNWNDGTTYTWESFSSGEPNNGGEQCVELHSHGGWNDFPCWQSRAILCNSNRPMPTESPTLRPTRMFFFFIVFFFFFVFLCFCGCCPY